MLRDIAKRAMFRSLHLLGVNALLHARMKDKVLVLNYHGVLTEDHSLDRFRYHNTVSLAEFERHLQTVRRYFMQGGSFWGPAFSENEIRAYLDTHGYPYHELRGEDRADYVAQAIEAGKVVGHFDGRMEYGPRALGSRSILGDARNPAMQTELNLKIKYRESFRPFAPTVLAERAKDYFELDRESPYMLIVAPVRKDRRVPTKAIEGEDLLPVVRQVRSGIPAVTHVDYSARIQTLVRRDHPAYYDIVRQFENRTGCAVIVNTSFNVRGEPIVCTPADAYRCFM